MLLTKQHRKTKKIQKGRELVQKTMAGQFERTERERDNETIPTRSKVKYMYIYKSKYLHFLHRAYTIYISTLNLHR